MIELRHVVKAFGSGETAVRAVNDLSFVCPPGSFWAMMGPSGSGKSTLMNIIGCLDRPSSGHYLLQGDEISKLNKDQLADTRNRTLGFVFQNFQLVPTLTALENVLVPVELRTWVCRSCSTV